MTFVGIAADTGNARLTLRGDQLSPRVLNTGPDRARVAFVATTALLLAGDRVSIEIDVGPGCRLDLVDTAGTVAYDARRRAPGDRPSRWSVHIRVGPGAALSWHGEPFIAADGSEPHRSTVVELNGDGVACLRETLVLGRTGEAGGELTTATAVSIDGRPLLVEDLDLRREVRCRPGVMPRRVIDSVLLLGRRAPADSPLDARSYQLDGAGTVARHLGDDLHLSGVGWCFRSWTELIRPH